MNSVVLIGRLTKDPEMRSTAAGKAVASFTLAVDKGYGKDKAADFINCVAWEKLAENLCQFQGKGDRVGLQGRIQVRSYDADDGSKRYVTEVVAANIEFLGSPKPTAGQDAEPAEYVSLEDIDDEDLPF
jgi:single-strand DNA-binding protein